MKIICAGPFIGTTELELLSFRPYARWLSRVLKPDKIYISSHYDSRFLYDFISDEQYIPLYFNKSGRVGVTHDSIDTKAYLKLIREFRNKVFHLNIVNKHDIAVYSMSYVKFGDPVILDKKRFDSIQAEKSVKYFDKIVFLNCSDLAERFTSLEQIIYNINYNDIELKELVSIISSCKFVVTQAGFLAALTNLQHTPLFSWGIEDLGKYRIGGIYNFGNNKAKIYYCEDKDMLVRMLTNYFIERSLKCCEQGKFM